MNESIDDVVKSVNQETRDRMKDGFRRLVSATRGAHINAMSGAKKEAGIEGDTMSIQGVHLKSLDCAVHAILDTIEGNIDSINVYLATSGEDSKFYQTMIEGFGNDAED